MPPCPVVRAASQQPHTRYGSKRSEFIYPGTSMAQLSYWILSKKLSWRQENWLRISGVSFETKAEKEKIFSTKISFKRMYLESIVTRASSRCWRCFLHPCENDWQEKESPLKTLPYKQFILLPTVPIPAVSHFPQDVSLPKGKDGNPKEDHPSSRPNSTGHNKYLKMGSAVAINCWAFILFPYK